ncbi:SCO family protein [Nocardioidaceae bacterium]|nr:SCO family protein [Nocardioidaceae bacterium]
MADHGNRPRRVRRVLASALTAGALAATAACGGAAAGDTAIADDGLHGTAINGLYQLPPEQLTDTAGQAYDLRADTDAPLTLVFFGYTQCPDICQTTMALLAGAMTRLGEEDRADTSMLFVTTDPARDTAPALRAYLDRLDPSFEGVTGPLPRIVAAADGMGVDITKGTELPSGGYEVDHSTQVYAVDASGTTRAVWTAGGLSSADVAEDVEVLLGDVRAAS